MMDENYPPVRQPADTEDKVDVTENKIRLKGRRKIEMVRKEMLTVSLMTDGYPIDGKPKEKTEKMHPGILKRWIAFFAIVAIVAVVAYFAFAAQTPAKTSGGMMSGGGSSGNNANVVAVTGTVTPTPTPGQEKTAMTGTVTIPGMSAAMLSNGAYYAISLDNIPEKIQIYGGTYYIRDLKRDGQYLYGYFGSKVDVKSLYVSFGYFDAQGGSVGHDTHGMEYVDPQTKEPISFTSSEEQSFSKNTELPFRVKISEAAGQDAKFALITVH